MSTTFFTLEELGLRSGNGSHVERPCAEDDADSSSCVLEINELATLAELQPLWRELIHKTPRPTFCQSFEWLQLYCEHFGDQARLRALCLDEGGDTAGLTVLVERTTHGHRELTLPSVGRETLWPLGDNLPAQWRAVAKHLRTDLARRHVLDLRGLSDSQGRINSALNTAEVGVQTLPWSGSTALDLTTGFESFWSQVSPSVRSLVEAGEQRLATLGPTNFVRIRPQGTSRTGPHFSDGVYQDCLNIALNDERQLARSDSVLNAPERHSFLRDLLPLAWRHSAADLCLLFSGSRPIAFRFHTLMFGHLSTIWTGVDAEFRRIPLGPLLLFRTLRDSCQRGDLELDLGSTQADDARDWNGNYMRCHRFVVGSSALVPSTQQPDEICLNDH